MALCAVHLLTFVVRHPVVIFLFYYVSVYLMFNLGGTKEEIPRRATSGVTGCTGELAQRQQRRRWILRRRRGMIQRGLLSVCGFFINKRADWLGYFSPQSAHNSHTFLVKRQKQSWQSIGPPALWIAHLASPLPNVIKLQVTITVYHKKAFKRFKAVCIASWETHLRACRMGSHSVTCHPTQWTCSALTPARQTGIRITWGWKAELTCSLIAAWPGIEPTTARSQVRCLNRYATKTPKPPCYYCNTTGR